MNKRMNIHSDICMTKHTRTPISHTLDENIARRAAELFRVFGDPSRVRSLSVLVRGEVNVGTLAQAVAKLYEAKRLDAVAAKEAQA